MSDLVDKCQILLIFFNKKIYYKEICLSVKNRISESQTPKSFVATEFRKHLRSRNNVELNSFLPVSSLKTEYFMH